MTTSVEMRDIVKRFPGVLANDRVSLRLEQGTVHALIGENGAGKTTLMNILCGLVQPDEGTITVRGQEVTIPTPRAAIGLRIGMVHQHFMLVPSLSVAANVVLGKAPRKLVFVDRRAAERSVGELADRYGLAVDPLVRVRDLPVGVRQRVEILKALYRGADILILDEPTAVLTPQECGELFRTLRALAAAGRTIVFISHKLREVLAVSDRITVMRHARTTAHLDAAQATESQLARLMIGEQGPERVTRAAGAEQREVVRVEGVTAVGDRGVPALRGLHLTLASGTIVGIAGVEGNGQTELAEVLTGLRRVASGRITYLGVDVTNSGARRLREAGIAHIPDDRIGRGIAADASIEDNLILNAYYRRPLSRLAVLSGRETRCYADNLIARFSIATPSARQPVGNLSGGNMQKVVVGRELAASPRVVVAAQPTRGLDVGAARYIHEQLTALRNAGAAILLISADLDEVLALSDRIAVIYEGRILAVREAAETNEIELGLLMAGIGEPADEPPPPPEAAGAVV